MARRGATLGSAITVDLAVKGVSVGLLLWAVANPVRAAPNAPEASGF